MYLFRLHELNYKKHVSKSSEIIETNPFHCYYSAMRSQIKNSSTHRQTAAWVLSAHKLDFDGNVSR